MSGTVMHARLESQSARARLKRRRQPHWQALVEGRGHLGWQRWKGKQGEAGGRWLLRRYVGNNNRPPDLIDFAMTPNRRLSAVRCQET